MFSAQHKFGRLGAPAGRSLEAQIAALFPDVWYDPSDLTTLFQDSAGTTPVTALEQPVGLMLDKSRGLVLGSELVTNGDMSSSTGWTLSTGWTVSGGYLIQDGTGGGVTYNGTSVVGRWYQYSVTVVDTITGGAGATYLNVGGATVAILYNGTPGKTYTGIVYSTGTRAFECNNGGSTHVVKLDNISVRELPGYHAYHTPGDTTTRPVLSRRINLLTATEDFSAAAWVKSTISVSSGKLAPDGTSTATRIVPDTSNSANRNISQTVSASGTNTIVFYAKEAGYDYLYISPTVGTGNGSMVRISTASVVSEAAGNTTTVTADANGFVKITLRSTTAVTKPGFYVFNDAALSSFTGDGIKGVDVWHPSLVPADLSGLPYQRVNTTTDYDSDASKFPTFLRCDGVNDSLQTNAIDFTATDKMFVGAAVRKLSDAATRVLAELSANYNNNNGSFCLIAPGTPGAANYQVGLRSVSQTTVTTPATYTSPISNVLSASYDLAQATIPLAIVSRVDGVINQQGQVGNIAPGNFGNYKLYLFARDGTSLPFNGWFYGSIIKGATLSASQIALVERWLASKTKTVTLA